MKRLAAILLTCACGGEYSVAAPADDGGFLESRGEAGEEAATQDTATVDAPTCGAIGLKCCLDPYHRPTVCNDWNISNCDPKTNKCVHCGDPGEYCCGNSLPLMLCAAGAVCWTPYGGDFACYTCGEIGQPCCDPDRTTCHGALFCRPSDLVCEKRD